MINVLNVSDFMKKSVEDVEKLNEEYQSTVEIIAKVAVHFGEDVSKFKVEQSFALLGNFFERIEVVAQVSDNHNRRNTVRLFFCNLLDYYYLVQFFFVF